MCTVTRGGFRGILVRIHPSGATGASRAGGGFVGQLRGVCGGGERGGADDCVWRQARLSGLWVDDAQVAAYVAAHADKLIGFLSLDPTQEGWECEMQVGHEELGLRGIKLLPMYAGFSPDDEMLEPLWRYAERRRLPVLLHMGTDVYRAGAAEVHAAAFDRAGRGAASRGEDHPRASRPPV